MKKDAGFTLIELAMIIVITGILAVFASPSIRFFENISAAGASDETLFIVSSAQKAAIAAGRPIWVRSSASALTACHDPDCRRPARALSGRVLGLRAPAGSAIISSVPLFSFDGSGRPDQERPVTIELFGKSTRIEPETGLVWSFRGGSDAP